MLYVVDTPPVFNVTQGNNDDGQSYGLTGYMPYTHPKILDLQEIVELWAQYYGIISGEWYRGTDSAHTRWEFWFPRSATAPLGMDYFKPSRTFFDYTRMYDLCKTVMPVGNARSHIDHPGALFWDIDPITSQFPYYDLAQNSFFENCATQGSSEGKIEELFGNTVPSGGNWWYNDNTTTGITKALPLVNLCGTMPFEPNPIPLDSEIQQIWRDTKNVANHDLYLLTPEVPMMFSDSACMGDPFDAMTTPAGSTYQRWRTKKRVGSGSGDYTQDYEEANGYSNNVYTIYHSWSQTSIDDSQDYYHYQWDSLDDRLVKDNSDQFLYKHIPIPSDAFGQNVSISRSLLFVWEVEHRLYVRYSNDVGNVNTTRTYYYVENFPYTLAGQTGRFVDVNGNDHGNCNRWIIAWANFDTTDRTGARSIYKRMMDEIGFYPSYDLYNWGDTSSYRKGTHYVTNREESCTIRPYYFYSCSKHHLTQTISYPQT